MKNFFLAIFTFLLICNLDAQNRVELDINFEDQIASANCIQILENGFKSDLTKPTCQPNLITDQIAIPLDQIENFIAFSMTWDANTLERDAMSMQYRFLTNNDTDTEWLEIPENGHYQEATMQKVSELVFASKESNYVQISLTINDLNAEIENFRMHFFDPGNTEKSNQHSVGNHVDKVLGCPCIQPEFEGRLDWCPNGSCLEHPEPAVTPVSHLIVHHSAGTNVSSDWSGVVRSIWDFHVNSNGWSDIGYNWLVDPNGVLYEGREDNILGAHFCGMNTATMGVCVLGDFTGQTATDMAKAKLVELLAWKSCDRNIDPLGTSNHSGSAGSLINIAGHRDGCATLCPGDMLYPDLPAIRDSVVSYIQANCTELAAPSNLTLEYTDQMRVRLRWEDNSEGEDGFSIERSTGTNDNFAQIITSIPNVMQFQDSGTDPDMTYFYRVRAFKGFTNSAYSNEEEIFTGIVSTNELKDTKIRLFPNPVSDVLYLEIDSKNAAFVNLEISDISGRIIQKIEKLDVNSGSNTQTISTENLETGVYVLTVSNQETKANYKFVKK